MRKLKNARKLLRILVIVVSIIFVATMCVSCRSIEKRCQESVQSEQRKLVDKLNANSELIRFLEDTVYDYDNNTIIFFDESKKEEIQVKVNGKSKELDEGQIVQLKEVFATFNCERIRVFGNETGKNVEVLLGNVNVEESNVYVNSLVYSKSETAEERYGSAIYPNWYHETFFYT